jgi:hypothetical protein
MHVIGCTEAAGCGIKEFSRTQKYPVFNHSTRDQDATVPEHSHNTLPEPEGRWADENVTR